MEKKATCNYNIIKFRIILTRVSFLYSDSSSLRVLHHTVTAGEETLTSKYFLWAGSEVDINFIGVVGDHDDDVEGVVD